MLTALTKYFDTNDVDIHELYDIRADQVLDWRFAPNKIFY